MGKPTLMIQSILQRKIFVIDNNMERAEQIINTIPKKIKPRVQLLTFGQNLFFQMDSRPDLVIMNRHLEYTDIKTLIEFVKTISPETKIIIYSEDHELSSVEELFELGISDYIWVNERFEKQIAWSAEYHTLNVKSFKQVLRNSITAMKSFNRSISAVINLF